MSGHYFGNPDFFRTRPGRLSEDPTSRALADLIQGAGCYADLDAVVDGGSYISEDCLIKSRELRGMRPRGPCPQRLYRLWPPPANFTENSHHP